MPHFSTLACHTYSLHLIYLFSPKIACRAIRILNKTKVGIILDHANLFGYRDYIFLHILLKRYANKDIKILLFANL